MAPIAVGRVAPAVGSTVRPGLPPNATLTGRIDLTVTVARFVVRPDDGVGAFEPGQYFALGLIVDDRPLLRPYSTSSAPDSPTELEFLIRLVPDGMFTPQLWALRIGDRLRIGRPKGLFMLRPADTRTHLFIATGTGLAPFLSMVGSLVRRAADESGRSEDRALASPRAIVVHGVSRVDELAYRDRLEQLEAGRLGVRYEPIVSRPTDPANAGWAGRTGRLAAQLEDVCAAHHLDPGSTVAYLCGNPEMIASAEGILADRGFASEAIVSEQYWPAT
jgi:ferredoxin-NADP reductase